MTEKNPAVSIIIPMYNVEKYIKECLDSLIAQTFKDFEVIVVDDCSTDKSCEIAESYASKLNLTLIRSEKNSGYPGVSRNKGIENAKGKYLCFLDSDDALINTALSDFYNVAEEFQADVVHCERYFRVPDEEFTTDTTFLTADAWLKADYVTEPTLISDNINVRMADFILGKFDWSTCNNFLRREFVTENNLKIPPLKVCEDSIFAIYTLCLAETIVRIPNVVYLYRVRQNSLTATKSVSSENKLKRWGDLFFKGFTLLDKFFDEHKIFEENPSNKFLVFRFLTEFQIGVINGIYLQESVGEIDKIVRGEIEKLDGKTAITSFFFNYINLLKLQLNDSQEENKSLTEKNDSLRKFGMKMIEQLHRAQVENQNLKSPLNNESTETFINFVGK